MEKSVVTSLHSQKSIGRAHLWHSQTRYNHIDRKKAFHSIYLRFKTLFRKSTNLQVFPKLEEEKVVNYVIISMYGRNAFTQIKLSLQRDDFEMAQDGLTKVVEALLSGQYNAFIMDEMVTSDSAQLITTQEIVEMIRLRLEIRNA